MSRATVNTKQAPAAIGPYAQAVIADQTCYCSGQIPIDPSTGELIQGTIGEQTHQVMKNLNAVLTAAGSGFGKVIKCTIYLKDLNDFVAVNEVYGSYFNEPYPARACVEVSRLPKNCAVEIDCIAKV